VVVLSLVEREETMQRVFRSTLRTKCKSRPIEMEAAADFADGWLEGLLGVVVRRDGLACSKLVSSKPHRGWTRGSGGAWKFFRGGRRVFGWEASR